MGNESAKPMHLGAVIGPRADMVVECRRLHNHPWRKGTQRRTKCVRQHKKETTP